MNKLDSKARAQILHLLCEGQSIRAITRVTGASKNTVIKLLVDAGKACMAFHDANVQDVKAKRIQVDEIWSFTYAKQKNVALHMMYYNFVRLHTTLRTTPAMAAGVSARLWEIGDIVKLVEDAEVRPAKRGPYKRAAFQIPS